MSRSGSAEERRRIDVLGPARRAGAHGLAALKWRGIEIANDFGRGRFPGRVNAFLDIGVASVGIVSAIAFIRNPNSILDFLGFAFPYSHTVLIWAAAYVLLRRFYPVKPAFFLFLWGFQELTWNSVYLVARYPASLGWGATQGLVQWEHYTILVVLLSLLGFALIRRRLAVNWEWTAVFMAFELAYLASGVPIVSDRLTQSYVASNWIWEVGYNLVALPLYALMFREAAQKAETMWVRAFRRTTRSEIQMQSP